jgi:hypothetical protein
MSRNRSAYVNRSALIDRELFMTASNLPRASAQSSQARDSIADCRPMSHQNSGDHGYEMYPQQLVRLVGCHDVHAPPVVEAEEEKLH